MSDRDEEVLSWLDEHAAKLVLYARQWVGSHADAEDVFQEAFLHFWRRRRRARDPQAYLYRSVRNAAMNFRRSRRRRRRYERHEPMFAAPPDPAASAELRERYERIELALRRLPRAHREIVTMKIWGELNFRQIAEVMAMPRSTVHAHYRDAMGELSAMLHEEAGARG